MTSGICRSYNSHLKQNNFGDETARLMRKIDLTSFNIATSETARNINRRIVLDLIRTRQPISRADLARLSGLQRSTISVIADQLVAEQWITEGAFGHLPRGRKPRFLHLNVERAGIIGINVRPTNTTIALTDLNANFITQESFPTASEFDEFIKNLIERIELLIKQHPQIYFEGIGISVPGRVDAQTQKLIFAPNLSWQKADIKTPIVEALGLPVEIENAANACALAEIWFEPQAEGVQDLIAVTISEGIGTGIITNGQLVRGNGVAGEFGHVTINEQGLPCKCGNSGCWEVYASNQAAIRHYTQRNGRADKTKNSADEIQPTFDDILRLAKQKDAKAVQALESMAHYLGVGLSMLITGIAPQRLVLIGEITRAWDLIFPIIKEVMDKNSSAGLAQTKIVASEDAMQPRLRGSVALILQKHFGAPLTA